MTPSPDSLPSLSTLKDDLDSLLEDYLSALSAYQTAQATLHSALKDGYFHLARAKLALGPGRVGERSYDLGEKEAQTIVTISPAAISSSTPSRAEDGHEETGEGEEEEPAFASSSSLLSFSVGPRPTPTPSSPSSPSSPPASSSSLRRRLPDPSPSSPSPTDSPPPLPSHPSPLTQFSPLPPPSLRASASSFSSVVRAAAAVVEAERKVRERARGVKRGRRGLERREREGEAGGAGV